MNTILHRAIDSAQKKNETLAQLKSSEGSTMLKLALLSMTLLASATMGQAATLLLDVSPVTSQGTQFNGNYTTGTTFSVADGDAFSITALGALDPDGNGLGADRLVSLWDRTTEVRIASTTVRTTDRTMASGNAGMQFFLRDVTPFILGTGTYTLSILVPNSSQFGARNGRVGNGVTIAPGYHRNTFPNGGDSYPADPYLSEYIYGTLEGTPISAVPIPSGIFLLMTAVGGLALSSVRRRRS